ncbi:hypothetical protein [Planctomyces sp. SH-PL14]|uniref:hypothetical protein n=1 Tax=Planctomyces sp. SH-PL14 TaxID=1632864 RepID=UPI0012E93EA8|nr:hypothetical protein [Planctomyces sp. SH-PL14]
MTFLTCIFAVAAIVTYVTQRRHFCDKWVRARIVGQVRLGAYKNTSDSLKDAQSLRGFEVIMDVVPDEGTWEVLVAKECSHVLVRGINVSEQTGRHLCGVTSIEVLRFHDCGIDAGAFDEIGQLRSLRDIRIANCNLAKPSDVNYVLNQVGPRLVSLNLYKVPFDVLHDLKRCRCLESLWLYRTGFRPKEDNSVIRQLISLRELVVLEAREVFGEPEVREFKRLFPGVSIDDGRDD